MQYPKVYLAVDNVTASKRWTAPNDWMDFIKQAGARYIEVSADNECDPLYTTQSYIQEWLQEVKGACARNEMSVSNLYSGHGTYATIGLAHTDGSIRDHIFNNWVKPYIGMAAELDAGVGLFCHAFTQRILQSHDDYSHEVRRLENTMRQANEYAASIGGKPVSLEQMYSPHQYPWTIESSLDFVYNAGVYITLDTGHQIGQKKFKRPTSDALREACDSVGEEIWVGTNDSRNLLRKARSGEIRKEEAIKQMEENMDRNPHLFASERDSDLYAWATELGCYSPIIHLQQTDGNVSGHWAFTERHNAKGIVDPVKLLKALLNSYEQKERAGMPVRCKEITLTFELFYNAAEYPFRIDSDLLQSVEYWRKFVPEDGLLLNQLPCLRES